MNVGRWWVRRWLADQAGSGGSEPGAGRLYWLSPEGEVVDLGPASSEELRLVSWAWRRAYQASTSRDDKSKLARGRRVASSLGK